MSIDISRSPKEHKINSNAIRYRVQKRNMHANSSQITLKHFWISEIKKLYGTQAY